MNAGRPLRALVVALFDLGAGSGGPRRARQIARLLAAAGAETRLVGYREPGAAPEAITAPLARDGVRAALLARAAAGPGHRARYFLGLPWSRAEGRALLDTLLEMFAAERPDVVVLYNQDLLAARAVARLCRAHGVAFAQQYAEAHVPGDFPLGALTGRWWSERRHLRAAPRLADGNLVISRWLRDAVAARGAREILLLPSFVDVDEWAALAAAPPPDPAGEPHLMYVGEGARRDAVPRILAGLALARARGLRCRATFVGCRGRAEGAAFLPRASPAELAAHYRAADALILLRTDDVSSRACLPTRLGELLLTGRPVIVSDLPDYNLHVRDRESGYLVRGLEPGAVADAIGAALARTPANAEIGRRGRAVAREKFDWRAWRGEAAAWLARVARRAG